MYCVKCGNILSQNDKYCSNCGLSVDLNGFDSVKGKDKKKTILVVILVPLVFILIVFLSNFCVKKYDIYKKEEMVAKHLYDKYGKKFDVELISEDYEINSVNIDGTEFECGHNRNVKKYVFYAKTNDQIQTYVIMFEDVNDGEIRIYEE